MRGRWIDVFVLCSVSGRSLCPSRSIIGILASAGEFGVFTPQKLYVHRYRKNEIFLDWEQPLSAFDGKTGAQVAREAFRKHVSQRNTHYTIFLSGPNDSRYLGLYFTTVGEDTEKNDVFEHVE